jgi:hypothetical protein
MVRGFRAVIDVAEMQKEIAQYRAPTKAGRLFDPPVSGQRVKDLVREGRISAIKTDLGWLIHVNSIEQFQRERAE